MSLLLYYFDGLLRKPPPPPPRGVILTSLCTIAIPTQPLQLYLPAMSPTPSYNSLNSLKAHTFGMSCRLDKERENAAALEVFEDLLGELDCMAPEARLTALIEGVLAANIFDWGARACVDLYHQGTILEIYRCPHPPPLLPIGSMVGVR